MVKAHHGWCGVKCGKIFEVDGAQRKLYTKCIVVHVVHTYISSMMVWYGRYSTFVFVKFLGA